MRVYITSVMVDDQAKAEKFYTEISTPKFSDL